MMEQTLKETLSPSGKAPASFEGEKERDLTRVAVAIPSATCNTFQGRHWNRFRCLEQAKKPVGNKGGVSRTKLLLRMMKSGTVLDAHDSNQRFGRALCWPG